MKVGLNLLHLVPGETGGSEVYVRRLIPAVLNAASWLDLVLFVPREGTAGLRDEPWRSRVSLVQLPVQGRSRPRRVMAEQAVLPAAARRAGVDLLHNAFSTAPALPGTTQVTTIHDLIYLRFPEAHSGMLSGGMRLLVATAARRSTRVIAISESTKRDLVSYLGLDADTVDVVYEGPGSAPPPERTTEEALRRELDLGDRPIVLSVSAHRPHKNLKRLIEAIARVPDVALVVPGYFTPWEGELREYARNAGVADRVRFTGWLSDEQLEGLYGAATCMAYPSLAEGFGLPVLEAMERGVPVASSNATSLPEVGGEAALYFDPLDTPGMADAISRLIRDEELRGRLAAAGREQAARFSWERAATGTLATYERALAS